MPLRCLCCLLCMLPWLMFISKAKQQLPGVCALGTKLRSETACPLLHHAYNKFLFSILFARLSLTAALASSSRSCLPDHICGFFPFCTPFASFSTENFMYLLTYSHNVVYLHTSHAHTQTTRTHLRHVHARVSASVPEAGSS
jgi:hypothetical protein